MRKQRLFFGIILLLIYLLSGCAVERAAPTQTVIPAPGATVTLISPSQALTPIQSTAPQKIPLSWADLNLSGKLVFIRAVRTEQHPLFSIQQLDLQSGELTTRFQAPAGASIFSLAISPDRAQVILAYSEPAGTDPTWLVPLQSLYRLPAEAGGSPQMLFDSPTPDDQYLNPELSPDGKTLYFSHVNSKTVTSQQPFPTYELFRMAYPDGKPEKIADQAFWPRLSKDGTRLAYISSDIHSGKNKLYLADPDGKNARVVMMSGPVVPEVLDAPNFSPDGGSILFSASTPVSSGASPTGAEVPGWLDVALGVTVASAHDIASEWWSVPIDGGKLTQLTYLGYTGLFASNAPDGKMIAVYSANGLFIMKPDASAFTGVIQNLGGILGTVSWLP